VIWPGEPITDWLFKVWYLGWLLAVWAVPASFVVALLRLPAWLSALYLAAILWLVFPVGLLSSLSAESRLVVLRPTIVGLLLKRFGSTLGFYASSAWIVFICGAFGFAAVFGPFLLAIGAAVVGALGCLIYARLLGRLALIINRSDSSRRRARNQERTEQRETFDPWSVPEEESHAEAKPHPRGRATSKMPPKKKKLRVRPDRAVDPWAMPVEEAIPKKTKPIPSAASVPEDPYGPAEGTYELAENESSSLPEPHTALGEEKAEPYVVSQSSGRVSSKLPPVRPEISKLEEELAAPRRPPPVPPWPLVTGVYSFPFYREAMGPCGTMAFGFFAVIALLRGLLVSFP
jgi:hypothetical protein